MIHVIATFIGKDGSLGYKNGTEYILAFKLNGDQIVIQRLDYHERGLQFSTCPYTSLAAFLKNWKVKM